MVQFQLYLKQMQMFFRTTAIESRTNTAIFVTNTGGTDNTE